MELGASFVAVWMTYCDDVHTRFGKYANGDAQVGELPAEMNVKGRVAWYVWKGPYANLPAGWDAFWKKHAGKGPRMRWPPGDVYVCSPECHRKDTQREMLALIWCPIE